MLQIGPVLHRLSVKIRFDVLITHLVVGRYKRTHVVACLQDTTLMQQKGVKHLKQFTNIPLRPLSYIYNLVRGHLQWFWMADDRRRHTSDAHM